MHSALIEIFIKIQKLNNFKHVHCTVGNKKIHTNIKYDHPSFLYLISHGSYRH